MRFAAATAGVVLVAVFLGLGWQTAQYASLCNDESKHLVTGWWLLTRGECCLGADNGPGTAWLALPLVWMEHGRPPAAPSRLGVYQLGYQFVYSAPHPERMILASRAMALLAGIGMLVGVAWLSHRLFGPGAGLLSLALVALDPNLVAHFSLASPDALLAASAVLYLVSFDLFARHPGPGRAAALGAAFALAVASKYTAAILLPATALLAWIYQTRLRSVQERGSGFWMSCATLAGGTALAVLWAAYGFHMAAVPPFLTIPGLIDGFRSARDAVWEIPFQAFYLGEVGSWWPSYYLSVLFLKTPLPILLLWIAAAGLSITSARARLPREGVGPIALAGAFFAVCLLTKLMVGVRHFLPIYPLLAIGSGAIIPAIRSLAPVPRRSVTILVAASLVWLGGETARIHPHHLSYFNQIAGGPAGGMQYLGDSNLDWGQDLKELAHLLRERGIEEVLLSYFGTTDPAFYGIRYQMVPQMYVFKGDDHVVAAGREILAISVNNLQGIRFRGRPFRWLDDRKPVARAGYSILLYDVTGDRAAHMNLARIYARTGYGTLALAEQSKVVALEQRGVR